MELYETIREVIDLRSFSNLWFWIAVAVTWSMASHFIIGVPYDTVTRARRNGGEAEEDLHHLIRINTNRILHIVGASGIWLVGFSMFLLTVLVTLAIYYQIEFAQAVLCLFAPMLIVAWLSVRTARRLAADQPQGEALYRRLLIHRVTVQGVGMVAIMVTAMWGMWINLRVGPI